MILCTLDFKEWVTWKIKWKLKMLVKIKKLKKRKKVLKLSNLNKNY